MHARWTTVDQVVYMLVCERWAKCPCVDVHGPSIWNFSNQHALSRYSNLDHDYHNEGWRAVHVRMVVRSQSSGIFFFNFHAKKILARKHVLTLWCCREIVHSGSHTTQTRLLLKTGSSLSTLWAVVGTISFFPPNSRKHLQPEMTSIARPSK